jgi:hypothetical protein
VDDRYSQEHILGEVKFYLDDNTLDYEECCYLLLKVVEQAIRDYCQLEWSNIPYRKWHWETAKDFIFEDDYFIQWGSEELTLGNICEILSSSEKSNIDLDWIRRKSQEKYLEEKKKRNG